MAIYGKQSVLVASRSKEATLSRSRRLESGLGKNVSRKLKRFLYVPHKGFPEEMTSIDKIDRVFGGNVFSSINHFLGSVPKNERVRVLGWGSGMGFAETELAVNPRLEVIGFGADSYPRWAESKQVNFLHTTKEALVRVLRKKPVHLVFSYSSFEFIPKQERLSHLADLKNCLLPGGKIVGDFGFFKKNSSELDFLQKKGYVLGFSKDALVSLTRKD